MLAVDTGGGVASQRTTSLPPEPSAGAGAGSGAASADAVIAQVTDRSTGAVDTRQLASWVVEAGRGSPDRASAAYAQIESRLGIGDRSRLAEDVAAIAGGGSAYSAGGLAQGVATTGSAVLRQNPILRIEWHSTVSPVTGRSGFTGPLRELLEKHGIQHDMPVHSRPPGSVTSNSPAARNLNGDAARDAIARDFRADGYNVRTEQSIGTNGRDVRGEITPRGGRRVDVVAVEAGRGENRTRIDAESKLGRASASQQTIAQVEKDGARLTQNVATREMGTAVKAVGRVARPIGLALDAVQVGSAFKADGNTFGDNTQKAVGSLAGGAAGAWGGAQAGAAIGSLGGPVGTVVGGVVGAAVGGIIGSGVGEKAVGWVKSLF